jgi:hypothetical protein
VPNPHCLCRVEMAARTGIPCPLARGTCFGRNLRLELKEYRRQGAERIEQHRESVAQVEVLQSLAQATRDSADAAIASERAWVMVSLDRVPGVGLLGDATDSVLARIRCICSNQGKTPAKILEKRAALVLVREDNPLPLVPNLDIEIEDPIPHYLQSTQEYESDWTLTVNSAPSPEDMVTFLVIYGVVKYRHLFSDQIVHTTFGYRIRVDRVLERLIDYPKYNENT